LSAKVLCNVDFTKTIGTEFCFQARVFANEAIESAVSDSEIDDRPANND
jgi:hypothetical protein